MQHLIYHHKQKTSLTAEGQGEKSFRWLFHHSEDSLTSMVFSRLCYLPSSIFWNLLMRACREPNFTLQPGKLLSYQFWPRWNAEGTVNLRYAEPDVFLRFEHFDLLVEAKKGDGQPLQNDAQQMKEMQSYYNVYAEDNKAMLFLAVGGLGYDHDKYDPLPLPGRHTPIPRLSCHWKHLHYEVFRHIQELQSNRDSIAAPMIHILWDIDMAFTLHDFFIGALFETLPDYTISHYTI